MSYRTLFPEVEAVGHLLRHIDGTQVLAEATLDLILDSLVRWANDAGEPIHYNKVRALQTLSLVVTA